MHFVHTVLSPALLLLLFQRLLLQLAELSLVILLLIHLNVSLGLCVIAYKQLEVLISFGVLEQLNSSQVVSINHVFIQSSYLISRVLAFHILAVCVNVPSNFSYESVSSTLKDNRNAEVWVVVLFLQRRLD